MTRSEAVEGMSGLRNRLRGMEMHAKDCEWEGKGAVGQLHLESRHQEPHVDSKSDTKAMCIEL